MRIRLGRLVIQILFQVLPKTHPDRAYFITNARQDKKHLYLRAAESIRLKIRIEDTATARDGHIMPGWISVWSVRRINDRKKHELFVAVQC